MSRYLRHSYGWLWRQTPLQTLRAIEPHSSFLPCALTSRLRLVPTPTIPFSQTPGRGVGGFAQDSEGVPSLRRARTTLKSLRTTALEPRSYHAQLCSRLMHARALPGRRTLSSSMNVHVRPSDLSPRHFKSFDHDRGSKIIGLSRGRFWKVHRTST